MSEELATAEREIIAEALTSDQAYQLVKSLCRKFGSRFAGSQEEREAAGFLAERMRDFGLDEVELKPFEYRGWQRGSTELFWLDQEEKPHRIECIGLPYSPEGKVEAELIDLGLGTPAEFSLEEGEIAGEIVLVSAERPLYARENMHRRDKYLRAVEAGSAGFIWMRGAPGYLEETGGLPHDAPIPAAGISREAGFRLQERLGKGKLRVRLAASHQTAPTTSYNVIGSLKGSNPQKKKLIAGAHYDGHDIAEGALDNGAGTAVVMEAARLLAQRSEVLERSIDFVLFGAEEVDLVGSSSFVKEQPVLENYQFMINLDGGPGRPGGKLGIALQGWPELVPFFKNMAAEMGLENLAVGVSHSAHSDMYPFSEKEVPSGYLSALEEMATGRNWGHTRADTLDKLEVEKLREDSLLLSRILLRASHKKDWPVE